SAATRSNSSKSWAVHSCKSPSSSMHCAAFWPELKRRGLGVRGWGQGNSLPQPPTPSPQAPIMRVLQVDSGREWRGGQHQVWLLCRELGRDPGIEQILVTRTGGELARRAAADGINVQGTAWEIALDPRAWWHLRRTIAAFQPDIIHVHDSHALTLTATVALGRTLVATRRVDFHVRPFGAWRRPDRIIAVSGAVKQMLSGDGIAGDAITVVPDGIDPEAIRRAAAPPFDIRGQLRLSATAPLVVNAAALVDHKDQRTLVRAAHYA